MELGGAPIDIELMRVPSGMISDMGTCDDMDDGIADDGRVEDDVGMFDRGLLVILVLDSYSTFLTLAPLFPSLVVVVTLAVL